MRELLVIGPQRAGTTWLYAQLAAQPESVYLDRAVKENYLAFKSLATDPVDLREKYFRRASGQGSPELFVDVCPVYLGHRGATEWLLRAFPDAVVCIINRDPAERRKSFDEHRRFNDLGRRLLSPLAGDPLYLSEPHYLAQAQFESSASHLRDTLKQGNLVQLEYADLQADGGARWLHTLSEHTGFELSVVNPETVNGSRSTRGSASRAFYGAVRVGQHLGIGRPLAGFRRRQRRQRGFQSLDEALKRTAGQK